MSTPLWKGPWSPAASQGTCAQPGRSLGAPFPGCTLAAQDSPSQGLSQDRLAPWTGWPPPPPAVSRGGSHPRSQQPPHGQEPLQLSPQGSLPHPTGSPQGGCRDTYHLVVVVTVRNVGLLEKGAEGRLWEERPSLISGPLWPRGHPGPGYRVGQARHHVTFTIS